MTPTSDKKAAKPGNKTPSGLPLSVNQMGLDDSFYEEPTFRSISVAQPNQAIRPSDHHLSQFPPKNQQTFISAPGAATSVNQNYAKLADSVSPPHDDWEVLTRLAPISEEHKITISRNHKFIPLTSSPCSTPKAIASRIHAVLRRESIITKYNGGRDGAHHKAKCRYHGEADSENITFFINLFGATKKEGTIIEVTRWEGNSFVYQRIASAILDCVEPNNVAAPKQLDGMVSIVRSSIIKAGVPCAATMSQDVSSIADLIDKEGSQRDKYDSLEIGLKTLSNFTSCRSLGPYGCKVMAEAVVNESRIMDVLITILNTKDTITRHAAMDTISKEELDDLKNIRRLGLNVVRNLLVLECVPPFASDLIDLCISDLRSANENPHDAYLATKILTSLMVIGGSQGCCALREKRSTATEALRKARDVGIMRHSKLGEAAVTGLQEIEFLR